MSEPASPQENFEYHTDMPVGEILRRARVHYGQSLSDIERVLRIRASQLEAIETGDVDKLPGRVYAIGFVRSYSEYLGLDGSRMVQLFKSQLLDGRGVPELHFPAPASESKVPGPWVIVSSVAGLILVIAVWSIFSGGSESKSREVPPVPPEIREQVAELPAVDPVVIGMTVPAEAPLETTEAVNADAVEAASGGEVTEDAAPEEGQAEAAAPAPALTPEEPDHRVIIEVSERSWVDIRDAQGRAILSRVLEPGNSYFVPRDREGLLLTTGNAGGLVITVDGEKMPSFGKTGEVRRNIPLNADELKNMLEKRRR